MFKIVPNPTFDARLLLSVPGSEVGAPMTFTFRHKGAKALDAWLRSAPEHADDTAYLGEVIEAWAGVQDPDGAPVPYTADALRQLLDAYPSSPAEIVRGYLHQLRDARAKN